MIFLCFLYFSGIYRQDSNLAQTQKSRKRQKIVVIYHKYLPATVHISACGPPGAGGYSQTVVLTDLNSYELITHWSSACFCEFTWLNSPYAVLQTYTNTLSTCSESSKDPRTTPTSQKHVVHVFLRWYSWLASLASKTVP